VQLSISALYNVLGTYARTNLRVESCKCLGDYAAEAIYTAYSGYAIVNMTENRQIILALADFIIPAFRALLVLPLFMGTTLVFVMIYASKHSKQPASYASYTEHV
jgi:hypothetical protein